MIPLFRTKEGRSCPWHHSGEEGVGVSEEEVELGTVGQRMLYVFLVETV